MFKKFIYMTALSMALASFPNASAAMECIINGCSPYNSSALMCNNISKCINVGSLNFTKNYSIAEYNPTFNKFSLAMNIISPIVSTILGDFCCRIIFRYCSKCNRIKQIKHMSEIKISNMRRRWENFLSSEWITLFTGLCAIFAIKNDLTGIFISLIPPVVFTLLIFGTYFVYAILYSSEQQCKEDISYFDEICDSNYIRSIQDISKNDIIRKRKYIVESLKQRGKLDNVIDLVSLQNIVSS